MNTVDRLAEVEVSNGTIAVSPMTMCTRSAVIPNSSAATCASTVRAPCPMSDVAEKTVALPSKCSRTSENEADAVDEALMPSETPRPRSGPTGPVHPIAPAALASAVFQSPSHGVSFGTNGCPLTGRLRRRISTRSIPRISAASFNCDSTAQDACGVPKPRNAVLGVVCDRIARAMTRALGVTYGPHPT